MACRTEPAEMLRKLANQYNTTLNLASASRQKQLFHQEEMKKEDTISSFTARLLQYNMGLAHTVLRITPEDMVLKLLDSLPDQWQYVKELILNTGELNWESAVSILLKNEDVVNKRAIGSSNNNDSETALTAEGKGKSGKENKKGKRRNNKISKFKGRRKCFYCLKPGHGIKQYRLKAAVERHCEEWKK